MSLSSFMVTAILVSAPLLERARSAKPPLTLFGEEVKKRISDDTYDKIFSVNTDDIDQLDKAIKISTKKYFEILGLPFDRSVEEKDESENKIVGLSHINSDSLFHAQTAAIFKAFTDMGILTSDNIGDIAQKYVDELNEAAKSVKDVKDVVSVFTAMTTGIANFLKAEGVTSEESVKQNIKDFLEELDKYQEKPEPGLLVGLVGSLIDGVINLISLI